MLAAGDSDSGVGGFVIVIPHWLCIVFESRFSDASRISTVKKVVPATSGVPVISPVEAFSQTPIGRLPDLMVYTYGGTPPVAIRLESYFIPIWPLAPEQANVRNGGGPAIRLKPEIERADCGSRVATTTSVKENGSLVGPRSPIDPEFAEVNVIVPTNEPVPNGTFVSST
jgi:hypothetical protein